MRRNQGGEGRFEDCSEESQGVQGGGMQQEMEEQEESR